jgi:GGDEF domain-containing protein
MSDISLNPLTFGLSVQWFFLPPFIAPFTVIVAILFASDASTPVDNSVWWLVGLLFIVLTVFYGICIRRHLFKGFLPVQLAAQGLLLCPLSLSFGAQMFQWVGVIMTICGAVILLTFYYKTYILLSSDVKTTGAASSEFDNLPLPCAVTDSNGNVLFMSDALLQLVQVPRAAIIESKITSFLPSDKNNVDMGGKTWRILHAPMQGGKHCFQLEEVRNKVVTSPIHGEENNVFIDAATSLCTRFYAIKRVEEELYRVRRYQRGMSVALLRMTFLGSNEPAEADNIFKAYCKFVRAHTRVADIPCLVAMRDILMILPETSLENAEEVIGRLVNVNPRVQEELAPFDGLFKVRESVAYWESTSEDSFFDQVLEKLDMALGT